MEAFSAASKAFLKKDRTASLTGGSMSASMNSGSSMNSMVHLPFLALAERWPTRALSLTRRIFLNQHLDSRKLCETRAIQTLAWTSPQL